MSNVIRLSCLGQIPPIIQNISTFISDFDPGSSFLLFSFDLLLSSVSLVVLILQTFLAELFFDRNGPLSMLTHEIDQLVLRVEREATLCLKVLFHAINSYLTLLEQCYRAFLGSLGL